MGGSHLNWNYLEPYNAIRFLELISIDDQIDVSIPLMLIESLKF